MLRQPIVAIVGHVDHGKSSILEVFRGISITKHEAGGITQSLRSYDISLPKIKAFLGPLIASLNLNLTIPGVLFLDTPGHAAFQNMRRRGGNLADIAILVIDIQQGVQPQTLESIEILRQYKTPFVIALNKIDLLEGFRLVKAPLFQVLKEQPSHVIEQFEKKLYSVVAKLGELNLNADRFDRVDDYTKQIAIIPVSAKTTIGLQELLSVVVGLSQKYLEKNLRVHVDGKARATILEVEHEVGLGTIMDIVLYDGVLKAGEKIAVGTINGPTVSTVRSLKVFDGKRKKLVSVSSVSAAAGVKVVAPKITDAIGGMPLLGVDNEEAAMKEIEQQMGEVMRDINTDGIVAKADTLGSLEALSMLLKNHNILVKRASIGKITKHDIKDALTEKDESRRCVLGFNVKTEDAIAIQQNSMVDGVKILVHPVIYQLIDDYVAWKEMIIKKHEQETFIKLIRPCRMKILRGCVFRQSNPAVVGVRIEIGSLKANTPLMKADGTDIGEVKSMQLERKNADHGDTGQELAIALPKVIVGRQIREEDILLADIPEQDFRTLKEVKKLLNGEEVACLKELASIKRRTNPHWGL